jgi:uncharacterized membrane protein
MHLCARCTGLVVGIALCWMLFPVRSYTPVVSLTAAVICLADGLTQLRGWRESTNPIRFATGLAVGMTVLPGACALLGI